MRLSRWSFAPIPDLPISGGGGGSGTPSVPASGSAGGQPGAGSPSPAPGSGATDYITPAQLQAFGSSLVEALAGHAQGVERAVDQKFSQWSQRVSAPPGQPQTPARGADPNEPSELLLQLAKGDLKAVDERVVRQLHDTGVVGWLGRQATNAANANEAAAKAAIDNEFGEGSWDKLIRPTVDKTLGDSVAARADPQTFHHALAAAKGQHFTELATRSQTRAKAAEEARAAEEAKMQARYSPWMPGNGVPPGPGSVLDSDDTALLAKVSAKTHGNVPKADEAAKLRDLVWRKGTEGVSMEDMSALFGK